MRRGLQQRGYPPGYLQAIDIDPARSANDVAAGDYIRTVAEQTLRHTQRIARERGAVPPTRVDLVAHSMGAFSSRYFAALLQPQAVRTWIAIAGSNHGTNALCGSPLPGDRQMCPAFAQSAADSAIQVRLNGTRDRPRDPSPYGVAADSDVHARVAPDAQRCLTYFSIRIEPDPWIEPQESALLAGAGGLDVATDSLPVRETQPGNYLFTGNATHDDLPAEPQIIELVARILAAADRQWAERCNYSR